MDRQILEYFFAEELGKIPFSDSAGIKDKIEKFKNCNDRYLFWDFTSDNSNKVELLNRNEMINHFENGIRMNAEVVTTFEEFWTYCALQVIKNCDDYSDQAVDIVWSRVQKNNI